MSCLCREGEKQCVWWVTREFNGKIKGFCVNPNIVAQTKFMCDGTQNRYIIQPAPSYQQAYRRSKVANQTPEFLR